MKKFVPCLSIVPCCVLLANAALPPAVFSDDLPQGVSDTQDPNDIPLAPADSRARIQVPDGFHVTLFAGEPDVRRPIAFDFDDRGRLWVVENYSHPAATKDHHPDRILIFEDTDNDGQFDKRKVFWSGGRYLSAIAYGHGGVWIGNSPELSFIPDRDGDDVPDSEPVVVLDGFVESSNNVLNNFHWGPDGWLYGAIGLKTQSHVGKPGTPKADRVGIPRGIWRMHPVTHKFDVQAIGMVNPWGADFNQYGDLITSNTVIAHAWHIVPGMFLQRRGDERDYPYAYGRIQSISDHLHWGGGQWQASRDATQQHSVAGGGHAHCGGMVYLGGDWPDKYQGTFFTCNLHGNRVNNDLLVPHRSTYIATHSDDFLLGNDPWFRGLTIKYGPDGGVYVSDWHDLGECHDTDGSHRTSGRIYKVVHGEPLPAKRLDLTQQSTGELVALQTHRNAWFARHARRLLQERAVASEASISDVHSAALPLLKAGKTEHVLRAMWTLHVTDQIQDADWTAFFESPDEHVRRWAVRLWIDQDEQAGREQVSMSHMARWDPSAKVRLALAVSLQRIPLHRRWSIARSLLEHAKDANDPCLPLMIWYGVEPLVEADLARALQFAAKSRIPLIRRYIARRALDVVDPPLEAVVALASRTKDDSQRYDYLTGMREALAGRGTITPPPSWHALYREAADGSNVELRSVAVELARIFGDRQAIADLQQTMADQAAKLADRRSALRALLRLDKAVPVSMLHTLLHEQSELRTDALHALALKHDETTPAALFRILPNLTQVQRQSAASVLVARGSFVRQLLAAIRAGTMSHDDVSAYSLQQLRSYKSRDIQAVVASIWPESADVTKASEIGRYKKLLTAECLADGRASAGRKMFGDNCSKCHTLFGTGGNVGPDLTGSGRANLDYVLSNLIDPSALVDEAYRLTTVEMNDGRLLSGFLRQQGEFQVILRTQDAEVSLPLSDIDDIQTTDRSMMPEGLLRSFSDEQIRDLVVYLASPDQVAMPLVE